MSTDIEIMCVRKIPTVRQVNYTPAWELNATKIFNAILYVEAC